MVERHTMPSPESAKQDPSRRRTEIYMQNEELTEHIKLREHADYEVNLVDKLLQETDERTRDEKKAKSTSESPRMQRHKLRYLLWKQNVQA